MGPTFPHKFTEERREQIINDVSNGVPQYLASEAAGIHKDTFQEWVNRGQADLAAGNETEYSRFSVRIKQAQKKKIALLISDIDGGADKWQGKAWILERCWNKYFSANQAINEMSEKLAQLEKAIDNLTSSKD